MSIRKTKSKTRGTRYAARVHLGDGKYKLLAPRPTRAAARQDEANWLIGRETQSRTRGNEFVDFYLEGYAENNKASSLDAATSALGKWKKTFGSRLLASIDETEAEEWAREHRWAVPPVVTMFNYAIKKRVLDRNPFAGLSKKGQGRKYSAPLSVAEIDLLAVRAEKEHKMGAFVTFAAYSGMRVGEAFALEWDDIDFKENRILVKRRLYRGNVDLPKGNRVKRIALLPEARDALLTLDRSSSWVFLGKRGARMSYSTLIYYWQKISPAVDRPNVTPHELRHFCGHYLFVTKGLPERVVAEQLGHQDGGKLIRTLYGHGDHGALQEIDQAVRRPDVDEEDQNATEGADVLPFKRKAAGDG